MFPRKPCEECKTLSQAELHKWTLVATMRRLDFEHNQNFWKNAVQEQENRRMLGLPPKPCIAGLYRNGTCRTCAIARTNARLISLGLNVDNKIDWSDPRATVCWKCITDYLHYLHPDFHGNKTPESA